MDCSFKLSFEFVSTLKVLCVELGIAVLTQNIGEGQARRSIALCWKNTKCPTIGLWLKNLISCLALEKLTYVIRKKPSEFDVIWKVFLNFVKNGDIEDALVV